MLPETQSFIKIQDCCLNPASIMVFFVSQDVPTRIRVVFIGGRELTFTFETEDERDSVAQVLEEACNVMV